MKKVLFIFIFCLYFLPLPAKTILNIEEGTTKTEAIRKLNKIYGYSNVTDKGSSIEIINPSFSGFSFNLCEMFFDPINDDIRFNGALFQKWFDISDINQAKGMRDKLLTSLKDKYGNQVCVEFKNDQGFTCCEFGNFEESDSTGVLELQRLKGNDGKERLYIFLNYLSFDRSHLTDEL